MAFLSGQLFVRASTIPHSGKGLFTKKDIRKGERIIEYKGRKTTWKEVNHRNWTNGYIFYINRNVVVDASGFKKAHGRYANDARGISRKSGLKNNAEYRAEGNRVYIDAVRNIPAGSEILVNYGKEYWDIIRYNQKISKQQR
ncbi:MAG: SET domain-containing protein [Bacteroidota bacterium]|nr:SET domain-containing protein [Bacteroidota bacterium]MDP4212603.1 SET domain-containing protein [Bacteroidota bacterium]MDP4248691.1 SET domain-containing protein [Bacteroidota bacterium]